VASGGSAPKTRKWERRRQIFKTPGRRGASVTGISEWKKVRSSVGSVQSLSSRMELGLKSQGGIDKEAKKRTEVPSVGIQ